MWRIKTDLCLNNKSRQILVLISALMIFNSYAEAEISAPASTQSINSGTEVTTTLDYYENKTPFINIINSCYAESEKPSEKQRLREKWSDTLGGVDIFMPYLKAEELKDWVEDRGKITILKFQGEPDISNQGDLQYTFKMPF